MDRFFQPIVKYLRLISSSQIFSTISDFVYPSLCLLCKAPVKSFQCICEPCWDSLPRVSFDSALYLDTNRKITSTSLVDDVVSCFIFESNGSFQQIIHALKYQGVTSVGGELGSFIANSLKSKNIFPDCIIPIPLHKQKYRERGYNQSEIIARGIAKILSIPVEKKVVKRIRYTQSQTKLSAEERHKNMDGAFTLNPSQASQIENKSCLLVDDVITTGSTMLACASALKVAHPAKLFVASAAIANFSNV
ncbi:MAG: ComF family protein [Bacteroidetes bacterium]|nr:ComF family protein [Bacteroidota bacterium]